MINTVTQGRSTPTPCVTVGSLVEQKGRPRRLGQLGVPPHALEQGMKGVSGELMRSSPCPWARHGVVLASPVQKQTQDKDVSHEIFRASSIV